ncbi:MAG: DUF885 domain-containing protein [Sphingobacteriales bacterium]|nr:MAG: DUF885 domain-containing protein [Sphingobacteriales bacterium]
MKKLSFVLLAFVLVSSCKNDKKTANSTKENDDKFDRFKGNFIEAMWKVYPGWANGVGYHKYDSILVVPDAQSRERELAFAKTYLDSLQTFKTEELSANNQIDFKLMENQLKYSEWNINKFKAWQWDPSMYNVGESFALLISETYAPLENRLHSFAAKLNSVESYYAAAKQNINKPSIPHTDLAIAQNRGSLDIFGSMLEDSLKKSTLPEAEKQNIRANANKAISAIQGYANWLEKEVRPTLVEGKTATSFRIGKELFDEKFQFDIQSGYSAEEIYNKAVKRKGELHTEMAKLATELWPKYFANQPKPQDNLVLISKVIDTLSRTHANRDSFQLSVEKQLPELVKFINDKNILYLDPKKPLVVRQTPDYMAGVSVASINSPGPYDKGANTYYNVGSLKDYTAEMAESHLREYNKYTLQIINIHEAIPGHYTQLVYSNQSLSLIKSIFGNGAMVEGWAVYTERMMLEEGYGNNEPEMWLMYYKWHLRAVCNTILDYGIQVKNMSEKEALDLMIREAFQQEAEAKGKWKRATLSQVQLCSYFTGFTEIYDFREELKKKQGDKFNLKNFHEKFLSYGSAPVKYIRELMLEEMN